MSFRGTFLILAMAMSTSAAVGAQTRPSPAPRVPVDRLPAPNLPVAGLPWPEGLGRKEALTGHIAAIDQDQMMVKSLDLGEILFWVDSKTIVRVDKFALALSDLRIGDPVAVRLKKIKGRGPYATEILPHPDVRHRKERGPPAADSGASTGGHSTFIPPDTPAPPLPGAGEPNAAKPADAEPEVFPALPKGANGVVGTVTAADSGSLELRDPKNQTQKVLVTGVTVYKRHGSNTITAAAKPGDRVAVTGDRLDSGEWIAREVHVQGAASKGQGEEPQLAAGTITPRDGVARFTGSIASLGNEEVRVQTPAGERVVIITGVTEVRRMGIRGNFASLRKGDQVSVTGDVLEGGVVLAREITVTKLAGS